ncbi:MAG: fructose-bisphosphate aldolase [Chloroflexi bacterium]|nr:fructose-bisphosphate aldolase [Chloroflexota bacterium]
MMPRVAIDQLDLSPGKRTRLYRLLYDHGPGHGLGMFLPLDQGLEHGPRDFWDNPDAADPEFQLRLAEEGHYSAIVLQVGLAERYFGRWAGRVPLVLKLNGKTEIPSDDEAFSPLNASVEDAVRLGADAVGYTLYVGSPSQDRDFIQFSGVRQEATRLGMPVIVWSYPRGRYVQSKGGQLTSWAIEYAARVAQELGADLVKVNLPENDPENIRLTPKPYSAASFDEAEAVRRVIWAAGRAPVLVSGGSKVEEEDVIHKARISIRSGATGIIFGRNIWQRPYTEALGLSRIEEIIREEAGVLARAGG